MKALVYTKPEEVIYREEPEPAPGKGQVLVKVAASGVCGSDMHAYHGHDPRRVPPLILGHEVAGTVASGKRKGERVVINPLVTCGMCVYCESGRTNLCPTTGTHWNAGCGCLLRVCGDFRTEPGSPPRFLRHGEGLPRGTCGLFSPCPQPGTDAVLKTPCRAAGTGNRRRGHRHAFRSASLQLRVQALDGGRDQQVETGDGRTLCKVCRSQSIERS